MKFIFSHPNRKRVYCVRAREARPHSHEIIVIPAKGKGYHLYPEAHYLATCLLREIGLSEREAKRRAPILAATPLLNRVPPWETCESELRAFVSAVEAFL